MFRINFSKDAKVGSIKYLESSKMVVVSHPDAVLKNQLTQFFTTEQEFWIPESNKIDDHRIDKVPPITSQLYFQQSLCRVSVKFGVVLAWATMDGKIG